jgi:lysyl-tRNA synthetase, class II
MARALATARIGAAALGGFAVVLAASGWLYVVQPRSTVPGPPVPDALPLDELSRRSAVPLVVFLAVWGAAAVLLGALARFARLERLTAAALLALGVGLLSYVADGVSIAVVRQIPVQEALDSALRLKSVYLPAILGGLAGAALGRDAPATRRTAVVVSALVAAAGALDVLHATLPGSRELLLQRLAPDAVAPLAAALTAPIGAALLVCARGLARQKRRAWTISLALLLASTALHTLHGFNDGGFLAVTAALVLVARRRAFDAPGDPEGRPRVVARAALAIVAILAFAFGALWVNRMVADQPFTAGFALRETSDALVGLNVRGSSHLSDEFGAWFPLSILILGIAGVGWVLAGALAPWRHRVRQEAAERRHAHDLVAAWGADTLAPFVLRADKSYFFSGDRRAFLAFRVVGGVAIVSGDPIGPRDALEPLVASFVEHARRRDWRIAILGASERFLDLYRRQGLHALYHGDEAVVETASFSLEGRAIRKVRQSVHRLEKAGYRAWILHPREIDRRLRADLEGIARAWRHGEPNRGFVMALDALFRLDDDDAVFVLGLGPDGRPEGFLHFALSPAASALSLSSMPRLSSTPNGFNEWLVCEAVAWARASGYARVSLNFAPFAALLAPEAELGALEKIERRALIALKGRFQLDNLLLFNRKFFPSWERRFVVYERRRDLPRVGIAALAAEAYLPFSGRARE